MFWEMHIPLQYKIRRCDVMSVCSVWSWMYCWLSLNSRATEVAKCWDKWTPCIIQRKNIMWSICHIYKMAPKIKKLSETAFHKVFNDKLVKHCL